jgi:ribosome biogenesis GTPase
MKSFDFEEEFHARERKQHRKERKLAQQADRSKYKKSNEGIGKRDSFVVCEETHRGRVISITGEGVWVDGEERRYLCTLKGLFKKERSLAKNLVAVGDWVRFALMSQDEGVIVHIEERYSSLARTAIGGKKEQLIAVNVDMAVIVVSIVEPPLKPALVDRYLIAAEKGGIHPIVVIHKIDLLERASQEEQRGYREFLAVYEPLGYPILSLSSLTGVGVEFLQVLLQGKTTVFSGQSGVGKSSLINRCFDLSLKVGELAQKTYKGTHTTTTAELLRLPGGGYCVDTPGIRSFSLWELQTADVVAHFREFCRFSCKFPDCTHFQEPGCGVLIALERGELPMLRYLSYQTLWEEAKSGIVKTTWS